jgi:hypothetical protein
MIVNHKDAIKFLVSGRRKSALTVTILNLHGILAQNLLPDPAPGAAPHGRSIQKSTFHPRATAAVEECFSQLRTRPRPS